MALHYLTVPDMLWINLQVTGAPQGYRYERLEEATFYQYGRGTSLDPVGQAARLLTGFRRMRPLAAGNEATAFVATLAFLSMNGIELNLADSEAPGWLAHALVGEAEAAKAIASSQVATEGQAHHAVVHDSYHAARQTMDHFPDTLKWLLEQEAPAPLGR